MKKILSVMILVCSAFILFGQNPKYVFLFIGDGMSTPQRMIADEFARKLEHGQLSINTLPNHATTRTASANSLVTDSAAAATAIACGEKTNNGRIGMSADGKRKLVSLAEVAKEKGKKVGIVTSVTITHATPAGFYAHRPSRSQTYEIGLDLINSGFDYFGGGGAQNYDNKKSPEYKGSIYDLAAKAGYKVAKGREEFEAIKPGCGKVFVRGCDGALPYEINSDGKVPTLAEFTAKGIELMQDHPNGFFMMVEGGAVDWCGHSNEAAANLREVLTLDKAVRVALDFAKKHPDETLIVVTGDHETGGMTMGFSGTGYALYMDRLVNQKCSIGKFDGIVKKAQKDNEKFSFEDAKKLLTEYFGFQFSGEGAMVLKEKQIKTLEKAYEKDLKNKELLKEAVKEKPEEEKALKKKYKMNHFANAARIVMNEKAGIGWTSGSHTALPVLTTSTGVKAELFTGFIDNTDISKKMKSIF